MLRTSDLDYELPESVVATVPAHPRDSAKLMVIHRDSGTVEHRVVADLAEILSPGDLLVRNSTRVLPARFRGVRLDTGGRVEGLYLQDELREDGAVCCRVLLKMRRHRAGATIALESPDGGDSGIRMVVQERAGTQGLDGSASLDGAESGWIVRIESHAGTAENWLGRVGLTPLPPYILAARKRLYVTVPEGEDRRSYQTVFASEPPAAAARPEHGSVAAPTAGLHFTPELLAKLDARGVRAADVVLHVGLGTFKPVETEYIEQHPMHTEWCMVPRETAELIRAARAQRGRVVAIGTTAARTLESFLDIDAMEREGACATQLLITPGYRWKHVDALLTNFHLPRSTLMAMVASMLPGGVSQLRDLYTEAIARGYRFYSFGDAMLVL